MSETTSSAFAWSLPKSFQDCIFLKKKMIEYANVKKLYGFINNKMGIAYGGIERYSCIPHPNELEQMKDYKEIYNKKEEWFDVAFTLPKHKWGRITPVKYLSLSIFHRPTRHSLCEGIYIDIDMENAAPFTLNEICESNGINNKKNLKYYAENPKEIRQKIMEHHNVVKDIAKQLPIAILNGGCYKSWIKNNNVTENEDNLLKFVTDLEKEIKPLIDIVFTNNQQILKDVIKQDPNKWKTDGEKKRGVMALWSQTIERKIQETAITYLVDNKGITLETIVPSQDGFMILEKYWYDGLLKDINDYVVTQMGIKISFKNKPFDEAIVIPEFNNIKSVDEWMDLLSAKKLADRFLEEWSEIVIKYNCNVYIYYDNRWFDETKTANQHKFTICISENLYDKLFNDIESDVSLKVMEISMLMKLLRNATSNTNAINNIIKHIISKAKETEKDFNSNPFLLGFNNGVYDLLEDEFRDYKYDDYITLSTKYDYSVPDYEDEEVKILKDDLVGIIDGIQPNEENRLLFLQILASGLDGRAYQKLFLLNGQGGNGKGLTGSLMDSILGDYYHQPANGIIKDVEKANTPSPDMINLKNKRYINFKEVQGAVKVAMLRNLTGGGKFSGRYLNQNPESFSMTATFVMEFNVAPELDGKPQGADYRRLVDLDFPINFTDDPNKIGKVIGGILYKKANSKYETQEFLQSVKLIFLDLLLDIYRKHKSDDNTGIVFKIPENIRKRTELFIENQNLFQRVFNELWCKVEVDMNNKLDVKDKTVTLKEIWESIMASEDHRKLNYKEKRLYNRDEFYKWIETLFKIAGNTKTGKIIIGLQRKEDVDEIIDGDIDETATENIL